METYDIVMLVVLIGTALFGAIKGFAWQLASIGSIVLSYSVAYNFREQLSESIHADPPWNRFLAMLILFIGTSLVTWVAFRMVSRTIDRMRLKEFDRQIGALFGLAKGGLYCILMTMFGVTLLGDSIREKIVISHSGHYIASVLDRSEAFIPEEIHEVVGPYLDGFDKKFKSTEKTPPAADVPPPVQAAAAAAAKAAVKAATEAATETAAPALPDSFWDPDEAAASPPLPVDPRGWLPPQDLQLPPLSYAQPPAQQPAAQRPAYQQAERPRGSSFPATFR